MTQPLTMLQIDAFTAAPFAGNPAGVCFLDHDPARMPGCSPSQQR